MPRQLCKRMKCWPVVVTAVLAVMGGAAYAAGIWTAPATMMKAVAVAAVGRMYAPATGLPDKHDDPQPLHGDNNNVCGVSSSVGSGSSGPGLHVTIATGNVWTDVPILKVYGGGETTLDLTLSYNSVHAGENRGLGLGWTHNYDMRWYFVTEAMAEPNKTPAPAKAVLVDANGRRNAYRVPPGALQTEGQLLAPPGRDGNLAVASCSESVEGWYCTRTEYEVWCCEEEGSATCSPCPDSSKWPRYSDCCTWFNDGWGGWRCIMDCPEDNCCAWNFSVGCSRECEGSRCVEWEPLMGMVCTQPVFRMEMPNGPDWEFRDDGKITKIVPRRGPSTTFAYNGPDNQLSAVTDGYGRSITFIYDALNRLYRIKAPNDSYTTLTYYSDDPDDPDRMYLKSITDPEDKTTMFGYQVDSQQGQTVGLMTTEVLKNGRSFTCEYGETTRTIKDSSVPPMTVLEWSASEYNRTVIDGQGKAWTYTTNDWQQLVSVESPSNDDEPVYYASAEYGRNPADLDQYNRLILTRNWGRFADSPRREYTWASNGSLAGMKNEGNYETTFAYDDPLFPDLLTTKTEPSGGAWTYWYKAVGPDDTTRTGDLTQVVDPLGNSTGYTYTYYDNWTIHTVTKTDRNGYRTISTYGQPESADAGNLLEKKVEVEVGEGAVSGL